MLRRLPPLVLLVAILVALLPSGFGQAAPAGPDVTPEPMPFSDRYPAAVLLTSAEALALLVGSGVDVADVRPLLPGRPFPQPGAPFAPLLATVYINAAEAQQLADLGLVARPIPNPSPETCSGWPTYSQFVTRMQAVATAHPDIVRMTSIGQSVQERELWVLKITDNPDAEEDEPEFRFVSTHHGNEGVGTEMTIRLAELLTDSYGTDPVLTELVDEIEIWLWPIYNPDGYEACTRYNANGKDLNRNFPDRFTDPVDDPSGHEPETQAAMYFTYAHRFVMGANYHTGALVVNYPWDAVAAPGDPVVPVYAPDDAIFLEYGTGYAQRNPIIWSAPWPGPVIRGWQWYQIYGGMQDWAYYWHNEHHVTIEISNGQPGSYGQMGTYWDYNREAMLWWMARVLRGARGRVYDGVTGAPLDATVDVVEIGKIVRTDPDVGDYHRLLLPGTYTLHCHADGYLDQYWPVTVVDGPATVQDCALYQDVTYAVAAGSSTAVGRPGATVTHTVAITNVGTAADSYAVALAPGDWPAALLDPLVGPLQPQQAGQARVRVQIPPATLTATVLMSDVLGLQITSAAAPSVTAAASGTTYAVADLSVAMGTDDAHRAGLPGRPVTYTLVVTNGGDYSDTYALALSGNAWPTQVVPGQVGPLGPGAAAAALVRVDIPVGPAGMTDTVTVAATSGWNAQVRAQLELVTLRSAAGVTANDSSAAGAPGDTVTHTVLVTNTGEMTDSYTVALQPGAWPAGLLDAQVGPLAPGQAAPVRVTVDIPRQVFTASLLLSDVFGLQISSTAVPEVGAEARGTTYALAELGVSVRAAPALLGALGGQPVVFDVVITNTGSYTDSYTLELSPGAWPATAPTETQPLGPGQAEVSWLRVAVPPGPPGEEDVVGVQASSRWDASVTAAVTLTAVRRWGVYLPLVSMP